MVRGRHRGLPVAVDRSILLPEELVLQHPTKGQVERTHSGTNVSLQLDAQP